MNKPLHIAVLDRLCPVMVIVAPYILMEGFYKNQWLAVLAVIAWLLLQLFPYPWAFFTDFPNNYVILAAGAFVGITGTRTHRCHMTSHTVGGSARLMTASTVQPDHFPSVVSGEQPISLLILVFLYPSLCYFHQLPTKYLSRHVHLNGVHLSYLEPLESRLLLSHNIKPNSEKYHILNMIIWISYVWFSDVRFWNLLWEFNFTCKKIQVLHLLCPYTLDNVSRKGERKTETEKTGKLK